MALFSKLTIPNAGKDTVQTQLKHDVGGNAKGYGYFEKKFTVSYEVKHTLTTTPSNSNSRFLSKRNENTCPTESCVKIFVEAVLIIAKNLEYPQMSIIE